MRKSQSFETHRKLFVVDLENLLGVDRTAGGVNLVWNHIRPAIGMNDQVLVASGPTLAKVALFELKDERVRYYVRSGVDGADLELLDRVDEAHASKRYDAIIIGSGDGRFTSMAYRARAAGLQVWQVTGRGLPSRKLAKAAHLHAQLNLPGAPRRTALAAA